MIDEKFLEGIGITDKDTVQKLLDEMDVLGGLVDNLIDDAKGAGDAVNDKVQGLTWQMDNLRKSADDISDRTTELYNGWTDGVNEISARVDEALDGVGPALDGFRDGLDLLSQFSNSLEEVFDQITASSDDMQAALNAMQKAGVERVFLTPHVMADLPDNRRSYLQDRFACMKQFAPEGIELRLAAEYMLDVGFRLQMADGLLTYADRQVLVETSYLSPPPDYLNLLYELSLEGYTPVLAHPERYMYMTKEDYFRLKDKGYKFQLNLFSLAGVYGARPAKYAAYLMKEGFYDYAGSDLHHPDDYKRNLARLKLSGKMLDGLREVLENNKGL